ncbi:hypothetical protein IV54_GL002097 [Levilactobacillus paucivorans]|uniref:Uncharacterized protein n=1 Tax=Levilactobacillus paucivorans TaxID=616990 RepID=A0A0R2LQ32_9LACO|nr:helveticin J family class III bacteriocin [Levilactobacillus paucivorans]KRO03736.1 hypothetical protein IV54_GL002097 [Levilactobacillus paucivorans]
MSITPHLLSDFGVSTEIPVMTPHNAMQNFIIDKQNPGIGYGTFGPRKGEWQIITKYAYDVSNTDVTKNHITPLSYLRIDHGVDNKNNSFDPGHSGSLDIYHKNGQTYLLIADKIGDAVDRYGTQLVRVPTELVETNSTIAYSDLARLGTVNHIGSKNIGTPNRLEFAVSADDQNIVIWVFNEATESLMGLSDIDGLLNQAAQTATKEMSLSGATPTEISNFSSSAKKALFKVRDIKGDTVSGCSLQGVALTNGGSVYVACETAIGDPISQANKGGAKGIWRFKVGVNAVGVGDPTSITNNMWHKYYVAQGGTPASDIGVEVEGLQVVGDDLYLGVAYHGSDTATEKNRLYHFDKTLV